MRINIKELKEVVSKLALAIEKTKLNPKSGWIELRTLPNSTMSLKVSNFDYFFEATVSFDSGDEEIHATVTSDTFIPLVSKLDDDFVDVEEKLNCLIFKGKKSEYTFPIIKEDGKTKELDEITFDQTGCSHAVLTGKEVASVAETNAKGLSDSIYKKEIQAYVYMDNDGAITFTDNIYVNAFDNNEDEPFKFLLNETQAKLLKVFAGCQAVDILSSKSDNKVCFKDDDKLKLILVVQSEELTEKFPAIKLRNIANQNFNTHVVINKKELDKALARLMVFDKKFDIKVLNYSKLVFGKESLKLVSIKNKNYEEVPYRESTNAYDREAVIRFADLVNQLKAVTTPEVDFGYSEFNAISIHSDITILIPEIKNVNEKV